MIYHITPINDLEEHQESSTCKCNPKVEVQPGGDLIVIHNSFDRRELVEKAIDVMNSDENESNQS